MARVSAGTAEAWLQGRVAAVCVGVFPCRFNSVVDGHKPARVQPLALVLVLVWRFWMLPMATKRFSRVADAASAFVGRPVSVSEFIFGLPSGFVFLAIILILSVINSFK